jgi:cytochrome c biogenesis protein CcmG/thiol:disulfide interchange protein DsbE
MRRFVLLLLVMATACSAKPATPAAISDTTPAAFRRLVASHKGEPLVVNFWATWCDPCKAEMPRLAAAAKSYKGKIAFVGVDVQDDPTVAARFAASKGVTYASVGDPRRDVAQSQGLLGLPVTQFYDASGKRVAVHQGELKSGVLTKQLDRLLKS